MSTYIRDVAAFATSNIGSELEDVRSAVITAFLDTVGCTIAGRKHPVVPIAVKWAAASIAGKAVANVLHELQHVLPTSAAAFVDSVASNAWDFDDASLSSHPSSVLVPIIRAEAASLQLRGRKLIEAYAKGYQVWWDLARRGGGELHAAGWHPTSVFGTTAGVVTLGSLRALPADVIAQALGIAASTTGGVVANFGTMTKSLQVGLAVQRAFIAVDLASLGARSTETAITGDGGLLRALLQLGRMDVESNPIFSPLMLASQGPVVKKYPICFASHRVVDGLHHLIEAGGIRADDVDNVVARVSANTAAVLEQGQNGPTGLTQFNLPFAIATVLIRGHIGLAEVQDEAADDLEIRALMTRVRVDTVDSVSALEPGFAAADRIVVTTRDGKTHDSGEIEFVRGGPGNPLSPGELDRKLASCLEFGEPDAGRRADIIADVRRELTDEREESPWTSS